MPRQIRVLNVAEKPSVAREVSSCLSGGTARPINAGYSCLILISPQTGLNFANFGWLAAGVSGTLLLTTASMASSVKWSFLLLLGTCSLLTSQKATKNGTAVHPWTCTLLLLSSLCHRSAACTVTCAAAGSRLSLSVHTRLPAESTRLHCCYAGQDRPQGQPGATS